MTNEKICGSTETTSGNPCEWKPGPSCPFHNENKTPPDNGRPTKLSKDRQERIAIAIEEGVPLVAACKLNGITHETHSNWMKRGEQEEEGPYADYFGRLTRALGHDQREKTNVLWETAMETGDTQTMLTILKQRYPDTWSEQDIGEAFGFEVSSRVVEVTESDLEV